MIFSWNEQQLSELKYINPNGILQVILLGQYKQRKYIYGTFFQIRISQYDIIYGDLDHYIVMMNISKIDDKHLCYTKQKNKQIYFPLSKMFYIEIQQQTHLKIQFQADMNEDINCLFQITQITIIITSMFNYKPQSLYCKSDYLLFLFSIGIQLYCCLTITRIIYVNIDHFLRNIIFKQ
ncbi:hypothetical protein pb186bvf_002719 [Paramecium bursaria]